MITRQSLTDMILNASPERQAQIVGRALVAIFKRQTDSEREANTVVAHNERGLTPADAKVGSITAKFFIKNKKLEDWQVRKWLQPNTRGVARIAKYWRQLDEVARERAAQKG